MCKETTTTYTECTCRVPSVEHCPCCPKAGYKKCIDFLTEEKEQKGICVGIGNFPAAAEAKSLESSQNEKHDVASGPIGWGDVFGLVGSTGD
jgi:hypothetical protein